MSGKVKSTDYYIGVNRTSSAGLSAAYDSSGKNNFEKDPFIQQLVQASIGRKIFKGTTARIYAKYNENKTSIDAGAFTDDRDYVLRNKNLIAGTQISYAFPLGTILFNYNYNWYQRNFKDDSGHIGGYSPQAFFYSIFQEGKFKSRSGFAEIFSNLKLSDHVSLLSGVDMRNSSSDQAYTSISNFGPFSSMPLSSDSIHTRQYSVYSSVMLKDLSGFFIDAGGRYNHHSVYGDNFTYSLSNAYVKKEWKFFANLSSGFRAPSLYQLYSEYGNRSLEPEESISLEFGGQYTNKKLGARLVYFNRRIKNVFTFYTDPITYSSKYINDDRQKDHGIEAELSLDLCNDLSIHANYTYVTGNISSKTASGKDTSFFNLYRRPSNTFNLKVSYKPVKGLILEPSFHLVSKFYEPVYGAAPLEVKGYHTINLYSEYRYNNSMVFFADLQNISGERYFEARGFNSKRFNASAGLRLQL